MTDTLDTMKQNLTTIQGAAKEASAALAKAFTEAITSGKSFNLTLQTILQSLSKIALQTITHVAQKNLNDLFSSAFSNIGNLFGSKGDTPNPLGSIASLFTQEGNLAWPPLFGEDKGNLGIRGEPTPTAAVSSMQGGENRSRWGADSSLHASQGPVYVTISTPDPESFRRGQVQIASTLAQAVARGQRGL